ncbi:MAG: hypothetical protein ACOY31_02845, partial [Bacillota bacterium]
MLILIEFGSGFQSPAGRFCSCIGNYALWITFAILEELLTFGFAPGLLTGRGEWFNPGCMIFGYN